MTRAEKIEKAAKDLVWARVDGCVCGDTGYCRWCLLRAALSLPPDAAPEAGAARCRERMLEVPAAYCALEPGHVGRCEFYMGTTPAPAAAPEHLLGVQASTLRFSCGHTRSEHERISPTWIAGACPAAAPGTERCPECEGSGEIEEVVPEPYTGSDEPVGMPMPAPCPTCHGTGRRGAP